MRSQYYTANENPLDELFAEIDALREELKNLTEENKSSKEPISSTADLDMRDRRGIF
jgi:hypothetical protein